MIVHAEIERPESAALGERPDLRVVRVEHRDVAVRELFEQFALGPGHFAHRPKEFEVHGVDVRDDADFRVADFREPADLAGPVHAKFEDRVRVPGIQVEDSERHAHEIVQIPGGREDRIAEPVAQYRGGQFLSRGLARASGDAEHLDLVPRPPPLGDLAQRVERIRHADDQASFRSLDLRALVHHATRRPGRERPADEFMAVEPFASKRHEHVALADGPRVGRKPGEVEARIAEEHAAAGSGDDVLRGDARPGVAIRAGHAALRRKARAASSRSSKCDFFGPTIW